MTRRNQDDDEKRLEFLLKYLNELIYHWFRYDDDFYGGQKRQETDLG
jgi:hypothetical protein